jgi:hypothetical protein
MVQRREWPLRANCCRVRMQHRVHPRVGLFDHLIDLHEQAHRHVKAKRLRSLEIDDQLELGRPIDRQIGWLRALENPRGLDTGSAIGIPEAISVAHEATVPSHVTIDIDSWNCVLCRQRDELFAPICEERIARDDERADSILHHCRERGVDVDRGSGSQDNELQPDGACRLLQLRRLSR